MEQIEKITADYLNNLGINYLPNYLGIVVTAIRAGECRAEFLVTQHLLAPNGFLHAGSIVSLADTAAGYGCIAHLPEGANGFTTVELKSNFLGTVREGIVQCIAKAAHLGKTTQVWDANVLNKSNGATIALFRCTQLILYPKP